MRYVIAAIAALVAFPAFGADVTWTWDNPTTNTDGSTIPAAGVGSLAGGRLEFGTCNGTAFGTKAGELTLTAADVQSESAVLTNLLPQTVCARVFVRNTYGVESDASAVASHVVDPPTPRPPSGLSGVTVIVTVNVNQ